LGVSRWILVDSDTLETSNLNRMPCATIGMVDQNYLKVDYVEQLIKNIYSDRSNVKTIASSLEDINLQSDLINTDLLVVATDNHYSRKIAQELALTYQVPLLCLGTHIEIQADSTPRMYCRISIPPVDGGWCLMCGNIISLQQASLELLPSEINHIASKAGYIKDIPAPAVFWLNNICASTAVGVIHGLIGGFIDLTNGLDWIYQFPQSLWLKSDVGRFDYSDCSDCYFCHSKMNHLLIEKIKIIASMSPTGLIDPQSLIKLDQEKEELQAVLQTNDRLGIILEAVDCIYFLIKSTHNNLMTIQNRNQEIEEIARLIDIPPELLLNCAIAKYETTKSYSKRALKFLSNLE